MVVNLLVKLSILVIKLVVSFMFLFLPILLLLFIVFTLRVRVKGVLRCLYHLTLIMQQVLDFFKRALLDAISYSTTITDVIDNYLLK